MAGNTVRVDPPVVKFKDINVGQRYGMKVTAANVGKTTKKILMEKPASKVRCTPGQQSNGIISLIVK